MGRNGDRRAWAAGVLDTEAAEVIAAVGPTAGEVTLRHAAECCYRLVDEGSLVASRVTNMLTFAALEAGLNRREIVGILRSVRAGAAVVPIQQVSELRVRNGEATEDQPLLADRILTRSAVRELADPEPLIDNVLDKATTALLYGKWATGKSFLAMDWGASVGTGRNWQGRRVSKCRVLYVVGEGAYGFKGRLDAWEAGWRTHIQDGELDILPSAVNLTRPLDVANLAALISWGGYGFVILDTLARCMVGADENSAKDCGIVVDSMARLLASTPDGRGVVLGVHHAGKDGKTLRGSSAFEGAADTVYFTSRDARAIVVNREKRKDGPEGDRHELKIDPIDGTGSAVLSTFRASTQTDRGDKLLAIFLHHFAATGASKAELRTVADMAPATFHRAVSDLLGTGQIENTGTDKRPFYRGCG